MVETKIKEEDQDSFTVDLAVSDTGIGIPAEMIDKVFEQFVQASSDTTRKFGGTGLGLAITKRLLELQGSEIKLESELGKGSKFSFEPAAGTYFQLLKYDSISNEKDTDFAIRLTKEHKIASVPLSVFYHEQEDNKLLRFCFAKKEETLERAAEVLCKL